MQVLYFGRAPRTKETLPDFLKWCRVTRPPLVFRGLTGSQRTPGFWGVTIAYRLALPPSMSGVHEVFHVSMLRKYTPDPAHVVDWGQIEVNTDGTFEEGPVCIVDNRDQVLRRKTVGLVRVLWRHYGVEESTWEREDTMRATYPFLFRDEGTWFSRLAFK